MDVKVFLDGAEGKSRQGIHILLADQKVRPNYISVSPSVDQVQMTGGMSIVKLIDLIRMKLNSYRDKDRTHLRDMLQAGLIDNT